MAAPAHIARENGRKGGRPPKRKNNKTLEIEAQRAAYQQLVLKRLKPIFEHQYSLVRGVTYLYRIEEGPNGGKEHVIVEDPDEIGDILAQMHDSNGELVDGVYNDKYYYITVKPPDNGAIKDMLDRSIGKATQSLEVSGKDGKPIVFMPVELMNKHGLQNKKAA